MIDNEDSSRATKMTGNNSIKKQQSIKLSDNSFQINITKLTAPNRNRTIS